MADAGENQEKMVEVLNRSTKQAEEAQAKVSTEAFQGLTLHIIEPPDSKDKKEDDAKPDTPRPPLAWTHSESLFYFASDVDVLKDLVTHATAAARLAGNRSIPSKTQAKIDSGEAQILWFLDIAKVTKLATKATAKGDEAQAQQIEFLINELGVNGLKSVGGTLALNAGNYDSLTKTFFLAPSPVQGLLKIFSFPPVNLRPEPGFRRRSPHTRSLSWDLDNAYNSINDLVNKFQPGMLNVLEQQLVGPDGGQPLSFQKDIFGPIGDRITLISDFKKPIKEDSQRMLVGLALEDSKAFQSTLNRLFELADASPRKREFQGTTIYDFELPNHPGTPTVERPGSASRARLASRSPRRPSSSPPTRRCSSRFSGRARPWPRTPCSRRWPRRFPKRQWDDVRPSRSSRPA